MENEMGEGKRKRTESPNWIKSHGLKERLSRVTNVENSCGTTGNRYVRDLRGSGQQTPASGQWARHI